MIIEMHIGDKAFVVDAKAMTEEAALDAAAAQSIVTDIIKAGLARLGANTSAPYSQKDIEAVKRVVNVSEAV